MKLLLLWCLPLCTFAFFLDGAPSHLNREENTISPENKAKLFQTSKVDPDLRRARLERLGKKLEQQVKDSQPIDVKERLEKSRPIQTVKSELEYEDLFDVNRRVGVAPYLFHGDIDLTEEQLSLLEMSLSEGSRAKRQIPTFAKKWPNNTVYFYFDPSINDRKKTSVRAAHAYLQSHTCINFVESHTAANRIRVFNGVGCYTTTGMKTGIQDLSLGDGCEIMGTAAHEFIHTLGSWHTQERSDRDTYVTVDTNVIKADAKDQFSILPAPYDLSYTPYEYTSVMHYSANSFAINRDDLSIVPKDSNYIYNMGHREVSFYDIEMINAHYGCAKCSAQNSAKCKNGGVPNPRNCAVCNCPSGYGGDFCDQRPAGCGESVVATRNWQDLKFSLGNISNTIIKDVYTHCNSWITAPPGKQIEVKIVYNFVPQCRYACPFNGIEIKTDADEKVVNPMICCDEFTNKVFKSALNPTPIVAFNRAYYSEYIIQYRFVEGSSQPVTVKPKPSTTTEPPLPPKECKDESSYFTCLILSYRGCASYDRIAAQEDCAKTCGYCQN